LAKKSRKKNYKKVLAIDLGGTKVAVAVVDESGAIISEKRESVQAESGAQSLIEQICRISQPIIAKHKLKMGGIASAGPLDPRSGVLINPTNFKSKSKHWGVVPLVKELEKRLKIRFRLENDAASAALAESWLGMGQNCNNFLTITLGTGVGVGVVTNGKIVRAGRNLHTEAGHLTISHDDKEWLCGCGNYGCAEAFLSGKNFTKKLAKDLDDPLLTGERLLLRAKEKDPFILQEFVKYGERLATLIYSLSVVFAPERVILSGGFSHAASLFIPSCEKRLAQLMGTRREGIDMLPKICISQFQDEIGLLGAAYVILKNLK
jgi:glucokinase